MTRRRAHKLLVYLFLASFLANGCASKWGLQSESSQRPPQWFDHSGTERIRHIETVKGFKEVGESVGNRFKYLFFGRSTGNTLIRPVALSTSRDGRFAIADMGCPCVHLYIPAEQKYRRIDGTNTEDLRSPVGVAFDDDLKLYITDSVLGAIQVFDKNGEPLFSIKKAGVTVLQRPTGLAYSSENKILYVVDTLAHDVYAFNPKGDLLFSFGERGIKDGQFNFPTHIAVSSGTVYIVDAMNFRIQALDSRGKFLASFGRHGDGSGDFAMPKGISVDRDGIFYIVDSLFDNVQLFNLSGDLLLTLGSRGSASGEFWLPSGIFLDENDKLYVCDTYNQRIQIFQIIRKNLR